MSRTDAPDPDPDPVPGPHPGPHPGSGPAADAPSGADVPGLGPRLREERRRSGLTLEAAAARVGLSPAHLSRLETGRRQPSLPVMLGLSRAYATTVAELLGEEPPQQDPVVRGGRPVPVRTGGWGYVRVGSPGRAMQALRVHVPPALQDAVVRVHPGEEWLYVTAGRLRLTLGAAEHLLDPGDAAHFDSLTPHRLAADSSSGAELLFVHTLLQSPLGDLCTGPAVH
ncbi:helix-turn-helix domain-containing protein [Streptomyces sp. NPDC001380]|uniref:helix-turn-helix domain-containing protein n=1 Tax=Streptomyces sp. NPDC001380 TaxID=3364566 RepID=UPI00368E4B36